IESAVNAQSEACTPISGFFPVLFSLVVHNNHERDKFKGVGISEFDSRYFNNGGIDCGVAVCWGTSEADAVYCPWDSQTGHRYVVFIFLQCVWRSDRFAYSN